MIAVDHPGMGIVGLVMFCVLAAVFWWFYESYLKPEYERREKEREELFEAGRRLGRQEAEEEFARRRGEEEHDE